VIVIVIAVAVVVAVMAVVPVVIVLETSVFAVPIAGVVAAAIMTWANPMSATVWRPGPVSAVPAVTMAVRVPVAVHPEELRSGLLGAYANDAWWRWGADFDANGYLGS
jgi:hypothetical protein